MIVIARDAEEKLMDALRASKSENPGQRCYFMAFSRADLPKQDLFETFLKRLQDVPDSYRAEVYICRDYDVFIFMQGFMQRHFTDFLQKLGKDLGKDSVADLGEVMEVGVHWEKLETLCERKLEKIAKDHATKEKERQEAEKITLEALGRLDTDQVASLARRRKARAIPLVMIADDDQIARTLVGNVVRENYEWASAKDGQECLSTYVSSAPDVLFLDIGLPDINGHDLLECLLQIDPDAYIIMFSGRKDRENIMKALEAGAQGFIGKPFTREKLTQYIERSEHLAAKRKGGGGNARAVP